MFPRDVHLQRCETTLDEWRELANDLKIRASTLSGDERQKVEDAIAALEHNIKEGEECVSTSFEIVESAQEAAKDDAVAAWNKIEEAVKKDRETYQY